MADLGTVSRPAPVIGRDGGIAALVGPSVTWLFGDTVSDRPSCADGRSLRTSTAAIGGLADPLRVDEPTDCGVPRELFTHRADEPFLGPQNRTALWPTAIVSRQGRATVHYAKLSIRDGVWDAQGIGVATMEAGATTATRAPGLVFGSTEPAFDSGNLVVDGYEYLYSSEMPSLGPARGASALEVAANEPTDRLAGAALAQRETPFLVHRLARVPVGQEARRTSYTFWDGSSWSPDLTRAAALDLAGISGDENGGLGVSVSWNPHLGKYLMAHSELFAHDIMLRTADRPEGPWSAPVHVDVPDAGEGLYNYCVREHPHFRSRNGQSIVLTYSRPFSAVRGEVRAVRVTLG